MQARNEPTLATSHFQLFLQQATTFDPASDSSLSADCLYGLYVSWARLSRMPVRSDQAFRAGMRECGVDLANSRLHMTGPAAADYIVSSYPAVA